MPPREYFGLCRFVELVERIGPRRIEQTVFWRTVGGNSCDERF